MTESLQKAFDELSSLPSEEQDRIAAWLVRELRSEHRWDKAFSDSQDTLKEMAERALTELDSGQTEPLDPNSL